MNVQSSRHDFDQVEDPRNQLLDTLEKFMLSTAEQPGAKPAVEALLRSLLVRLSDGPLPGDAFCLTHEAPVDQADEFRAKDDFDAVDLANLLVLFMSIRRDVRSGNTLVQLQQWRARIRKILQAEQGGRR